MPFTPDRFFTRVTQIDIEHDIVSRGVKCVLIDLDTKLLPRDTHQVPDDIRAWLKALSAAGVRVCILTNNWHHGAHEWAQRLGLPIVSHAIKPLPFAPPRDLVHWRSAHNRCVGWAFHAHAGVYGRAARFGRSEAHVAFASCGSAVHEEYAPREIMH